MLPQVSALGQKQTYAVQTGMSALLPKADMCGAARDVRFGPKADMCNANSFGASALTNFVIEKEVVGNQASATSAPSNSIILM
jgi:hypothetical protein